MAETEATAQVETGAPVEAGLENGAPAEMETEAPVMADMQAMEESDLVPMGETDLAPMADTQAMEKTDSVALEDTQVLGETQAHALEETESMYYNLKGHHPLTTVDENGHPVDYKQSLEIVFKLALQLGRRNCQCSGLSKEDEEQMHQDLQMCMWAGPDGQGVDSMDEVEILNFLVETIRKTVLSEVQASPFFSLIIDKVCVIAEKKYLPTFVRYVVDCVPKVELLGFMMLDETYDVEKQAKNFEKILINDWGLQMAYCRGQSYLAFGAESACLKKLSMNFLESFPLAVNTPSESCGLAYWLIGGLQCTSVFKVLELVEDLLIFFDQSPELERKLEETVDGLFNTPREALAEVPETCCSRWKKREDFLDILVDTMEGILSCLDSVSSNADDIWSHSMSLYADILSAAMRNVDFIVTLVILKNACSPLRQCSTVFRCGNPADILCEVEKIQPIIESFSNTLENISVVNGLWFEEAFQLASKVSHAKLSFPEESMNFDSAERYYQETLTIPLLTSLIEEMKFNFSVNHMKALMFLSLLPTCNPQPAIQEMPEKLPDIYKNDLPEPDNLDQDVINWAAVWKEKFQDASPPSSISETLLHQESKSHPNVSTLLRLVAVLPSVSMECDLMRTILNIMRSFLRSGVSKHKKTDMVMLHMHRTILQPLDDVLAKCSELDPEKCVFIRQIQEAVRDLQLQYELGTVQRSSGDAGLSSHLQLTIKDITELFSPEEEHLQSGIGGQREPMSFYTTAEHEEILKELWNSQFFSIITQQVTKIDGVRYIPVCVRFLDKQDAQCEETLAFVPFSPNAEVFAAAMETVLSEKWGLNMEFCRGQAVLSTGNVGIKMRSVSTIVSKKYPSAVPGATSVVSLNMWLARAVPELRVACCVATVEKMFQWFFAEPQLKDKLEEIIAGILQAEKANELKDKLSNDLDGHHDIFYVTVEILEAVVLLLHKIMRNQGCSLQKVQAQQFYTVISDFEFVITLVVLKNVLALTKDISQGLQGMPLEKLMVINCFPSVLASLNDVKSSIDTHHATWFQEAVTLSASLQIGLLHHGLQELISSHYKEVVSQKVVEHIISEVAELFSDRVVSAMECLTIVPYAMSKVEDSCTEECLTSIYREDLPDASSLSTELKMWKDKWAQPAAGYLPATILDTLKVSDIRCFGNIETLLKVLVVLPWAQRESNFRQGTKSLQHFVQQATRSISELHLL